MDFATMAMRVENSQAVKALDDTGKAIESVDKKAQAADRSLRQIGSTPTLAQLDRYLASTRNVAAAQTANVQATVQAAAATKALDSMMGSAVAQAQ